MEQRDHPRPLDALNVEAYRALYRLHLDKQEDDGAWRLAAAMAFLGKADEEENRFFEDDRPQGTLAVRGRVSTDLWSGA